MDKKKVSIIIPVYNVEQYIKKSLDSICGQDYENLQIILVDDGSTDKSGEICDSYAKKDNRIVVIHQENSGVSNARNNGLKIVEGELIGFIDSDDYVEPDYVSCLVNGIADCELSICGFFENMENEQIIRTKGDSRMLSQQEAMLLLLKENEYRGYLWNKLFFNKIIKNNNIMFDSEIAVWEDVLFVFEYLCQCKNVFYNTTPKYHYVYRVGSASHGENVIKKSYSAIIAKDKIGEKLPSEYNDVREQLNVRYITSALTVLRLCAFERKNTDVSKYEKEAAKIIRRYSKFGRDKLTKADSLSVFLCKIHYSIFEKVYVLKNN